MIYFIRDARANYLTLAQENTFSNAKQAAQTMFDGGETTRDYVIETREGDSWMSWIDGDELRWRKN